MRASLRVVALSLFAVVATSCGKSPTKVSDQLTQQESLAVYSELSVAIGQALANISYSPSGAPGPAATSVAFSGPITATATCSVGGTVDVSGSYDGTYNTDSTTYTYNYSMTITPSSCEGASQTTQFTINGDPSLTISGNFHWTGTAYSYTYTEQGGIAFTTSDGRSGSCQISYTSTVSYDGTTSTVNVTGSVCGTDISVASSA